MRLFHKKDRTVRRMTVAAAVIVVLGGMFLVAAKVVYPDCVSCSRTLAQWGIGSGPAPKTQLLEPLPTGASIVFDETFPATGTLVEQDRVVVVLFPSLGDQQTANAEMQSSLKSHRWHFTGLGAAEYPGAGNPCAVLDTTQEALSQDLVNSPSAFLARLRRAVQGTKGATSIIQMDFC
jgi:hypothetical protein